MKPKAGKKYAGDYRDAAGVHGIVNPADFDAAMNQVGS